MAVDGARAAARSLGTQLADTGVLKDPDDVFFLTMEELCGTTTPDNAAELVAERQAWFAEHRAVQLPDAWTGRPEPIVVEEPDRSSDVALTGFAVSPGLIEGPVRVIHRADELDTLSPGEILVCPFTDPSWSVGTVLAAGLAIDVGGPLSHGAIVARELGVPCVINTRTGTAVLRTGDLVRLDGRRRNRHPDLRGTDGQPVPRRCGRGLHARGDVELWSENYFFGWYDLAPGRRSLEPPRARARGAGVSGPSNGTLGARRVGQWPDVRRAPDVEQ